MLQVKNISKAFRENTVLRDVSFTLRPGEIVGLIGPSGGGKSLLLKIIAGVMEPDRGEVRSVAAETESEDLITFGATFGFLFQESALFDSMSVLENVAFPLFAHRVRGSSTGRDEAFTRAYESLREVGLGNAWKKYPGQLSGGMRRRVGIARALVVRPRYLLLDDPTGGLDPVAANVIMGLILRLQKSYGSTVVIVSHDLRRLLPKVGRVLALFDGRIVCDCVPHDLHARAEARILHFIETRFDFSTLTSPQANAELPSQGMNLSKGPTAG